MREYLKNPKKNYRASHQLLKRLSPDQWRIGHSLLLLSSPLPISYSKIIVCIVNSSFKRCLVNFKILQRFLKKIHFPSSLIHSRLEWNDVHSFQRRKPFFGNRMIRIKKRNVDLESGVRYCVLWEKGCTWSLFQQRDDGIETR